MAHYDDDEETDCRKHGIQMKNSKGGCVKCAEATAPPQGSPSNLKRFVGPDSNKFTVDFACSSIGRQRSTGETICLLLSFDREYAPEILADVIKTMGISIDEIVGWHNDKPCPYCGCSLMSHGDNGCD